MPTGNVFSENGMVRRSKRLSARKGKDSVQQPSGGKRGALMDISNSASRGRPRRGSTRKSNHGPLELSPGRCFKPKKMRSSEKSLKDPNTQILAEIELLDPYGLDPIDEVVINKKRASTPETMSDSSSTNVAASSADMSSSTSMQVDDCDPANQPPGLLQAARTAKADPCSAYEADILKNLRRCEFKYSPSRMGSSGLFKVQTDVNHTMRSILVDWLAEVAEEYKLKRQTWFLAINYIDRLLHDIPVNRTKLQLVGVSAMLLASKYEEIFPPSVDEYVYISDNTYTRQDVLRMESILLRSLKFRLTVPTACDFLDLFSRVAELSRRELLLAEYIVDATVQEKIFLDHPPSKLAAAAIVLSRYTLGSAKPMSLGLQHCSGYPLPKLENCIREMHRVHSKQFQKSTTLKAIHTKYCKESHLSVAEIRPRPI